MTVRTPVMSQTTSSRPGEPTVRAMSALTMKMPEPIMAPMTIIMASNKRHLALEAAGCGFGDGRHGRRGFDVHGLLLSLLLRMP